MKTIDKIEIGFQTLQLLQEMIPQWIADARAKGELTAEQEAAYGERQKAVFAMPEARPDPQAIQSS